MNHNLKFDIIKKYISDIRNDNCSRYKSWDICNKAFNINKYTNIHPLHLGFYLASWGMYRGSGGLLQKNHLIHEKAVKILYSPKYALLKCNKSNEVNINSVPLILKLKDELALYYSSIPFLKKDKNTSKYINKLISPTDTLLSKIILGTMACVPAYDEFLIKGIRKSNYDFYKFNEDSLIKLFGFIRDNNAELKKLQNEASKITHYHYPVMKIIDMYFWQKGFDSEE